MWRLRRRREHDAKGTPGPPATAAATALDCGGSMAAWLRRRKDRYPPPPPEAGVAGTGAEGRHREDGLAEEGWTGVRHHGAAEAGATGHHRPASSHNSRQVVHPPTLRPWHAGTSYDWLGSGDRGTPFVTRCDNVSSSLLSKLTFDVCIPLPSRMCSSRSGFLFRTPAPHAVVVVVVCVWCL